MREISYNIAKIHAVIGGYKNELLRNLIDCIPATPFVSRHQIIEFINQKVNTKAKVSTRKSMIRPEGYEPDFSYIERYLEQNNVTIITVYDVDYPNELRHIIDPPPVLYVEGHISHSYKIAVVGPRNPSHYAVMVTEKIVSDLAGNNIMIVSGMATGIDGVAHGKALEKSPGTIGILGHGIDKTYPASHRELYARVKSHKNSCLISEFPIGFPPSKYTFPQRNRIISGLVNGVLLMEAGSKSGSLITARHALEQGKNVYAVPGLITNPLTAGVHQLIREGATLVTSASDMLEDLYPMLKIEAEHKNFLNLNEVEVSIVGTLEKNPSSLEALLQQSDLQISELINIISMLEIKGIIKKEKNNQYFVTI